MANLIWGKDRTKKQKIIYLLMINEMLKEEHYFFQYTEERLL